MNTCENRAPPLSESGCGSHSPNKTMSKPKRAAGLYAEMDLTGVVSTLESHWVVLDAELSEVRLALALALALTLTLNQSEPSP